MDELELRPADREEIPASDVTADLVTRLRPGVGSAFLDDEGVLLDPATGSSHLLDAPGTLVVRCLDGSASLGVIAFDIADVLDLDRATVETDVVALARTLGGLGLLEGVARDGHAGHRQPAGSEGVPVGADLSGWDGWQGLPPWTGRTLLVSWGTSCGFCSRIAPELGELEPCLGEAGVRLVLVTTGDEEAFRAQVGDAALAGTHVESTPDFFAGLGTPVAYLVDADHVVLEPLAVGAVAVPGLCRSLLG